VSEQAPASAAAMNSALDFELSLLSCDAPRAPEIIAKRPRSQPRPGFSRSEPIRALISEEGKATLQVPRTNPSPPLPHRCDEEPPRATTLRRSRLGLGKRTRTLGCDQQSTDCDRSTAGCTVADRTQLLAADTHSSSAHRKGDYSMAVAATPLFMSATGPQALHSRRSVGPLLTPRND